MINTRQLRVRGQVKAELLTTSGAEFVENVDRWSGDYGRAYFGDFVERRHEGRRHRAVRLLAYGQRVM